MNVAITRLVSLFLLAALAGCSSTRPWTNEPRRPGPGLDVRAIADRDPSALFAVSLSGGGARAAAFGYGVLQELRETPCCWNDRGGNILDAVDLISGVSGGSIVAAYFAAFGAEGLARFEPDFLRQDVQEGLLSQLFRPGNLVDLTSPYFGRTNLLERRLETLYRGLTFGDLERRPRHPQLIVSASDLSLGTSFDFTQETLGLLCTELSSVPLSFAVASSSAVPLLLSPMTLRNYRGECPVEIKAAERLLQPDLDYRARLFLTQESSYLDAAARPYVHLVDGGLADNLGVRRILDRALSGGGIGAAFGEVVVKPSSVRHLVLIVVNAQREPAHQIDSSDRVPSTADAVDALLFGAGNRATVETQEFLADVGRRFQEDVNARRRWPSFAADAEIFLIQVNLHDAPQAVDRERLLRIPTAFSIKDSEVTSLIAAGREVLRNSPEFRRLKRSLGIESDQPIQAP